MRRKLKEIPIALYMDATISKEKLLEIYVNIIEYGPGLYGITDASAVYYGKTPDLLTPKEAGLLALLLPNPKRNSTVFHDDALKSRAEDVLADMLEQMCELGYLSESECAEHIATPISTPARAEQEKRADTR